jgi:hypothetical protein
MNLQEFLAHYASEFYDPVKAHEYYMKNRQLKGRSTSGMSDEQKEAWEYTKDQISTKKQTDIKTTQDATAKQIEQLQLQAAEVRQRISDKLKDLKERLAESAKAERQKIADQKASEIADVLLEELPKNATDAQKAAFLDKRKKAIAKIMSDSSSARGKVTEDSQKEKVAAQEDTRAQVKQVATDLKAAVAGAREAYAAAKKAIDEGYETTYQDEYDKILKNIKGKSKSSGKGAGKKAAGGGSKLDKYYDASKDMAKQAKLKYQQGGK